MKALSFAAVAVCLAVSLRSASALAGRAQLSPHGRGEGVKIGLFIPMTGAGAADGRWLQRGAELAVRKANREGGTRGRPFRLVLGAADRPWAGGGGELVRLVYRERVRAVIGAVDGRSGHLAEQIVAHAKGQLIFVTPWATDTTLTRLRIPWFFRVVPDDEQQARALVQEIFAARRLRRVAVITADDYDARMSAAAFARVAVGQVLIQLRCNGTNEALQPVLKHLQRSGADAIVLFGPVNWARAVLGGLRDRGARQPLFAPLSFGCAECLRLAGAAAEGAAVVTLPNLSAYAGGWFHRQFVRTYRCPPDPLAAYAYDAATAIVQAVRKAGDMPEAVRDALAGTAFQGATGSVRFDAKGNRVGDVGLAAVRRGRLAPLAGRSR